MKRKILALFGKAIENKKAFMALSDDEKKELIFSEDFRVKFFKIGEENLTIEESKELGDHLEFYLATFINSVISDKESENKSDKKSKSKEEKKMAAKKPVEEEARVVEAEIVEEEDEEEEEEEDETESEEENGESEDKSEDKKDKKDKKKSKKSKKSKKKSKKSKKASGKSKKSKKTSGKSKKSKKDSGKSKKSKKQLGTAKDFKELHSAKAIKKAMAEGTLGDVKGKKRFKICNTLNLAASQEFIFGDKDKNILDVDLTDKKKCKKVRKKLAKANCDGKKLKPITKKSPIISIIGLTKHGDEAFFYGLICKFGLSKAKNLKNFFECYFKDEYSKLNDEYKTNFRDIEKRLKKGKKLHGKDKKRYFKSIGFFKEVVTLFIKDVYGEVLSDKKKIKILVKILIAMGYPTVNKFPGLKKYIKQIKKANKSYSMDEIFDGSEYAEIEKKAEQDLKAAKKSKTSEEKAASKAAKKEKKLGKKAYEENLRNFLEKSKGRR